MSSLLVTGIGTLVTWDSEQPVRESAALVVEHGRITWVGSSNVTPIADRRLDRLSPHRSQDRATGGEP